MKRKSLVKYETLERAAPSEREQAAMTRAGARVLDRRNRFKATLSDSGSGAATFDVPHTDQVGGHMRLLDTFDTCSADFATDSLGMLASAMRHTGKPLPTDGCMNAALAMVDGIAPVNEVEAALAT